MSQLAKGFQRPLILLGRREHASFAADSTEAVRVTQALWDTCRCCVQHAIPLSVNDKTKLKIEIKTKEAFYNKTTDF